MILNARRVHFKDAADSKKFPCIILLAIEDITEMVVVAETLAKHAQQLEAKFGKRTLIVETRVKEMEKEISNLKKKK